MVLKVFSDLNDSMILEIIIFSRAVCHQGTCSEGFAVLITALPFPAATLIANPGQEKCIFLTVKMTTSKQILNPVLRFQQCFIFPLLFS